MKKLIGLLLLFISSVFAKDEAFRIRSVEFGKDSIAISAGTAFPVNLEKYGYKGNHYLMTAKHCVAADNKPFAHLSAEYNGEWVPVDVVALDNNLDVAILTWKINTDGCKLADEDGTLKDKVHIFGSPLGVPIKRFDGKIAELYAFGSVMAAMEMEFNHGDSGCPVFNEAGDLVGLGVAGVSKGDDIDHKVGLYIPLSALKAFLRTIRK